jgi:mRNA interferase MazF
VVENNIAPGHIVLAELPHHDGTTKKRPALLLAPMRPYGDYLACGISTKLRHLVPNFDEVMLLDDTEFSKSGLQFQSLIRLGWLALVPETSIEGSIGRISDERLHRLLRSLIEYLIQFSGNR